MVPGPTFCGAGLGLNNSIQFYFKLFFILENQVTTVMVTVEHVEVVIVTIVILSELPYISYSFVLFIYAHVDSG